MDIIYEYTDYRKYLSDYYDEQKSKFPYFSYRYFSNKAGFKTKDFIYRVIKGQKNLSRASCMKVSQGMGHTKREAEYFENLVGFNQARDHDEREFYLQNLQAIGKKVKRTGKTEFITHDQYALFSEWYHLVVRSLVDMYGFKDDYEWLARKINPPITPAQAKKSVALLEKLGLLIKNGDGRYQAASKSITTGEDVAKHAIQNYYLACMRLSAQVMDEVEGELRNITGLTLGVSKEGYDTIVEKLRSFRREIAAIAGQDKKADRVYKLHFHLIPVSDLNGGGPENG